jgi:hypothetical protein
MPLGDVDRCVEFVRWQGNLSHPEGLARGGMRSGQEALIEERDRDRYIWRSVLCE